MSYEKQSFVDGHVLSAAHLNHIEDGLVATESKMVTLETEVRQACEGTDGTTYKSLRDRFIGIETRIENTVLQARVE